MASKRVLVELSIISMVALTLLELVMLTNTSPFIFRLVYIVTPLLAIPLLLAVAWKRSLATAIMLIGLLCILGSMMLLPHMLLMGSISSNMFYMASFRAFLLGMVSVVISMIMVYRPDLLYVKNRPSDEDDSIKVWDGNSMGMMAGNSIQLIPLRRLLDDRELMLLPAYRYILVIIGGVRYLVPADAYVPVGSIVVRSNGMFIGVRKAL